MGFKGTLKWFMKQHFDMKVTKHISIGCKLIEYTNENDLTMFT